MRPSLPRDSAQTIVVIGLGHPTGRHSSAAATRPGSQSRSSRSSIMRWSCPPTSSEEANTTIYSMYRPNADVARTASRPIGSEPMQVFGQPSAVRYIKLGQGGIRPSRMESSRTGKVRWRIRPAPRAIGRPFAESYWDALHVSPAGQCPLASNEGSVATHKRRGRCSRDPHYLMSSW